ncbi:MAG: DUF3299 domain-containing protein [Hyphomonadaceae bacterium]|nr:DUF3299 domain-containing protein [Hyphomonadaceae bacterium]MBC6412605.1 DUF3299 domain-containing protein [Hyphomonadaceae bacterium]
MKTRIVAALISGVLAGCAPADTTSGSARTGSVEADVEVTRIIWDDLMPEGEFERLEALYENFFEELEARMSRQQTLMDAARGDDFDITSIIAEGSADDSMEQIGTYNVVEELDGVNIRIPGYIVPLDFNADAQHDEFLLVPYFGACLHTPPPPPNQILYVKAEPPAEIPDIYEPVWVEGKLETGRFLTGMGNSAYELSLSKLEPYEY